VGQAIDDTIGQLVLGLIEGDPLRGGMTKLFRIRVEDWRILYESRPDGTVRILRIAHRSDAYLSDPR
jgi:mRNA-degrading endonuclease RelE of RelBE toxin-antitoxin system